MNSLPRLAAALTALLLTSTLYAIDIHDTRLLSQPAVSADRIAFAYANDLWVANVDGSGVRLLTSHPGIEGSPRFSPDGKWIAFSGEYDGNTENEGVPPDVEVEQTPVDVIAGRDPQLEKAIEIAMRELQANPPKKPVRPAYPRRASQ